MTPSSVRRISSVRSWSAGSGLGHVQRRAHERADRGRLRPSVGPEPAEAVSTDSVGRRGEGTPARTASSCAAIATPYRRAIERQHGPQQQGHEPGEGSVGLTERRAEQEEAAERHRHDEHEDDRHEGADRQPGPLGLATTRAPPEHARGRSGQEGERERPAHDVPDIAERRGSSNNEPADRPSVIVDERDDREETGTEGEHERAAVLLRGGTVLFDTVEAVHRSLDLPQQDRPGDDGADESERQSQRSALRTGLVRLLDRVGQDARRPARGRPPSASRRSPRSPAPTRARSRAPPAR